MAPQASIVSRLPDTYLKALTNRFSTTQLTDLTAGKEKPLFFYGSLMLPQQIALVTGDRGSANRIASQMTPATLYSHERLVVDGASYPAVVASAAPEPSNPAAQVEGLLVFGLTDDERRDLDNYESGLYDLTAVTVETEVVDQVDEGGKESTEKKKVFVDAEVYIWGGLREELVETAEQVWSVEAYVGGRLGVY